MPTAVLEFSGVPVAKQSMREHIITPPVGRPFIHRYTDRQIVSAQNFIRLQAQAAWRLPPLTGPISLTVTYRFAWLRSHSRRVRTADHPIPKTTKPDLGNLTKLLEDALEGIVYVNDAQVWGSASCKIYADVPSTTVVVEWEEES